jgi:hypothetical protein
MNRKDLTHDDLLVVTRKRGSITVRQIVRVTAPRDDSSLLPSELSKQPYVGVEPIYGGPAFDLYDDDVDRTSVQTVVVTAGEPVEFD